MDKIPEELKDFYNSLENLKSLNIWNIQRELNTTQKVKGDWEEKVIFERKILNYNINKGKLITNIQITDAKGCDVCIDDLDIEYLKFRLNSTLNTWLLSRYSHLLWQKTRHHRYAEIAIDNYIKTINRIKAEEVRELPIILSAILYISKNSKKGLEEVREVAITLLDELPNRFKSNIVNVVLENNVLTKEQLEEIANKLPTWYEEGVSTSYYNNKNLLELGVMLYDLLKIPLNELYELLAGNEDIIIKRHPNDTDFVKYISIGTKAKYLRLANKIEEAEENLKEYTRLKQKVKLNKANWQLGEEETEMFNEYLNITSKNILDMPTDAIFAYFSTNEDILVDPVENVNNAKETIKKSISHLFNTSVFDINSNYQSLDDSKKIDKEIIKNYTLSHGIQCYSLFIKVFVDGIIEGKLNYYKVYEYMESHTWYGMKFKRGMTDDGTDQSSWLTMLAPGIHNLIAQFELSILMNTNKINNFVLALDSLTIKFEGVLRDFIRLSGGNTSTSKSGEMKEQLLEELLENEVIIEYFTIKDIELFKHAFTRKGKNLRNNIAHSFMEYPDYNLQDTLLVFFCILRLGKYTFKKNEQETTG